MNPIPKITNKASGKIGQTIKNKTPEIIVISSKINPIKIKKERKRAPINREKILNKKTDIILEKSTPLPYLSEYFFHGEKNVLSKSFKEK